jgi:hypothetical protein
MLYGDEYTVPMAGRHSEADAMAKLIRQKSGDLFVIGLREVQDAVNDINTDQQAEWTTSLRDSLSKFTNIIKEHVGLPPSLECDLEINMVCTEPPKERTYRMSPAKLREVHVQLRIYSLRAGLVRLSLRTVPMFYLYARRMVPCVCT